MQDDKEFMKWFEDKYYHNMKANGASEFVILGYKEVAYAAWVDSHTNTVMKFN